ncbi:hypothetical protein P2G74_09495 [Cronobacter muytjensii]|uniref:hypothetical protein n=1 Tax=Cronobacter muytjensii TaxID=413501 RepID=UPI0029E65D92|nr:hypothetical protein [Cronobacter muytjensii]EKS1843509.1 hypothetical protein [Cronobacter muytjensii]ELY3984282.1 hypothetical protein [Cronobacter muytjensii]ELY6275419.1 hypothetical protein [Cronobacter muytjensii]MEB8640194.1 hypothetical protein [Cronobacter muytjensii]
MKRFLNVLFFLCAFNAWGSQLPVITSITAATPEIYNQWSYHFTHTVIEAGSAGDWVPPTGGYLVIALKYQNNLVNAVGMKPSDGKNTISKLFLDWYYDGGNKITALGYSHYAPDPTMCLGYVFMPINTAPQPWSNVYAPTGCTNVPPVNEWCKLTTPEIVLDHGNITLKNAEGHSASAQVNIQCANPTAITFRLVTDEPYVYLDDGKSKSEIITVGNKPLKTKIDLPEGDSTLTIKDMLTGVSTEGIHSGSSVLVMAPY